MDYGAVFVTVCPVKIQPVLYLAWGQSDHLSNLPYGHDMVILMILSST
jgi:hypothetical protein